MKVVQVIGKNVQVICGRVVFWGEKLYKGIRNAEAVSLHFGSMGGRRRKGMVFV
ncbi:MAG: hypothetical protein HFI50_07880 [Lachnospiraceae bacterium]|jgi:hypothetical protein|nr:hypothetical protein [Lachnospiraceae bacterium]